MSLKILLPVSGKVRGERARKALDTACKLTAGDVIVVHAMEPAPKIVGGEAHENLVKEARAAAMQTIAPVLAMLEERGVPHRVVLVEETPVDGILHVAHNEQCDLIIMFTDGRDELGDMLLGSITERVLRNTDIPLLAVRK